MLKDIFPSSLGLNLEEPTHRKNEASELGAALRSRTEVGSLKVAQLRMLTKHSLEEEAGGLRQTNRVIEAALSKRDSELNPIGGFLERLDLALINKDQDWQVILGCLKRQDASYEEYKQVALLEYCKYLQGRLNLIETLLSSAGKQSDKSGSKGRRPASEDELAETSEFILGDGRVEKLPKRAYRRLPKGDTVTVQLEPQHSLHLSLAKHRFTLVLGEPCRLIDEGGREAIVPPGKNIVGRGPTADVAVNERYRSISRSHAIMEVDSAGKVKITDVSSHGTFLMRDDSGMG